MSEPSKENDIGDMSTSVLPAKHSPEFERIRQDESSQQQEEVTKPGMTPGVAAATIKGPIPSETSVPPNGSHSTTNQKIPKTNGDVTQSNRQHQMSSLHVDVHENPPDIITNISELSDTVESPPPIPPPVISPTETGKKVIHNFFFPPRQQSKAQIIGEEQRELRLINGVNLSASSSTDPLSSIRPPLEEQFEDEPNSVKPHHPSTALSTSQPESFSSPPVNSSLNRSTTESTVAGREGGGDSAYIVQEQQDKAFVEKFWTAYDEILILSLFTQVGILCRLGAAYFFRYFDGVFHSDSALFTNLPLNCLSCFVMGLLCSGESLMQIINTRFTPPRLQHDLHRDATQQRIDQQQLLMDDYSSDEDMIEMETAGVRRRRRRKRSRLARRKRKRSSSVLHMRGQQQESEVLQELREVQLLAYERRIRASICLLLFPLKQEDIDVVENYFSDGYRRDRQARNVDVNEEEIASEPIEARTRSRQFSTGSDDEDDEILRDDEEIGGFDDLILEEELDENTSTPPTPTNPNPENSQQGQTVESVTSQTNNHSSPPSVVDPASLTSGGHPNSVSASHAPSRNNSDASSQQGRIHARGVPHIRARQYGQVDGGNVIDYGTQDNPDLDQIISNVATGVSRNISRIGRVNLADGWDVGTSPQEKSEDLVLGLRDGLCGALSSFSSWISSMVSLFRTGQIGQAVVGLVLGIQLPLIAYRFGQYVSVYIFVWRLRHEKRRDERRGGYGIQLHMDEDESFDDVGDVANLSHHSFESGDDTSASASHRVPVSARTKGLRTVHDEESEIPSVRAIITALFIMCLVAQVTALNFFYEPNDRLLALSLLFSPLGVLARWRMMKFNSWRPSFPIGTFACNVTACALAGTLGSLLAGNPGPRERIALVSIIAGFGGTLSSVARFTVEILSLMDPILFRLDGVYYAVISAISGLAVSFAFSASVDWADSVE